MPRLTRFLAVVPLALACSGTSEPTQGQRIRLALNWYPEPEFGGFYEGVLGGHYEAAGFDVEIIPGGPGAPTLERLGTGRVEVAITSADDLLVKRLKGVEAVAVWAAFQDNPQGLLVHDASPVRAFADIPTQDGARISIEVGRPLQQVLWTTQGWEDRVEAVPYGGSVGPFLNDPTAIQQAYITSEPCVTEQKGVSTRFLRARDAGWNPYGTVVAVADPAPEWTARFVEATADAWKAYLKAPARADARITELNDNLTADLVGCITERQRPFITGDDGLGDMNERRWEATATNLRAVGLLPEGVKATGAWLDVTGDQNTD